MWKWSRRTRRERDLDDELDAFVATLTERHIARGLSPQEARRAALVETGGVQQVREATRDVWTFAPLETLARDVRYGARMLARAPGFAAVIIVTLGVCIGANATVFSVMHAVLWRPLPYPAADRLVVIKSDARGEASLGIADGEALDLRAEPQLFDGLANIVTVDAHVNVGGEMERVPAASATDEALLMLGAEPMMLGRPLRAAADGGMNSVIRSVVISHALWLRRLGGDPDAIGRHIEVNNITVEVVGVLGPDFRVYLPELAGAPDIVDVWFGRGFEDDRRNRGQFTLARLAPGVTRAAAQTRLDVVASRAVAMHAAAYSNGGLRLWATPLHDELTGGVRQALWVLAGAVAFVLMIGCANVATLLLARARARQREMAVRTALGAGRARLVRQLLTETALLAGAGAVLGAAVAYVGVALVDWLRPAHLPRQATIEVTSEAALFIATVALLVTIIFGLIPAFGSTRDAHAAMRAGRSGVQRAGTRRVQHALVVAEIALSIVPLIAAGLMLRTFVNMTAAPLGFDPTQLITAKVAVSFRAFPEVPDRSRLLLEAVSAVQQIPGVHEASSGGPLPLDGWQQTRTFAHPEDTSRTSRTTMQSILPGYLRVMRTPLIAGREFVAADLEGARDVAIVDENIARQLWPEGAIGRHIALERGRSFGNLEIVGVSKSVRTMSVHEEALPHVFVPYHVWAGGQTLVVRSDVPAEALAPRLKEVVEGLGTRRPVFDIRPMTYYVDQSVGETRFLALVLAGFAAAAILLAAVGLYGTLAYLTSLRTQEFGVRMALGASASRVLRTVAGEGLRLAAVGGTLGLVGALAATGALQGLLYNVTPFDGVTVVAVVALVSAAALAAALHPAWRASRTNPTHVLRAGE